MKREARLIDRLLESLAWRLGLRVLLVMSRDMRRSTPPEGDDVEFRELDRSQVLAIASDPALDMDAKWADEVLGLPGGCVGAFRNGVAAGYLWIALESAPDRDGLWLSVPKEAVYRYKAFVRPELRNMRILQRLSRFCDRVCVERGREIAMSYVAAQNAPSLAATKAIGTRKVGFIVVWRVLGRCLVLHSPGTRRSGLRMTRERPAAQ